MLNYKFNAYYQHCLKKKKLGFVQISFLVYNMNTFNNNLVGIHIFKFTESFYHSTIPFNRIRVR